MNGWALALLWLAGVNLRITLLAVPPLIPLIHEDLALSEKAVGALGGLPVLMFAFGALFGSLLLARTGAIRAMIAGLALAGLAGALRGLGPDTAVLFAMTVLMGLGIAYLLREVYVSYAFPAWVGTVTLQDLPRWARGLLFISIFPPMASRMPLTMGSPRPVPVM